MDDSNQPLVRHVFIQWLASQNLLVNWMDNTNWVTYGRGDDCDYVEEDDQCLTTCQNSQIIDQSFDFDELTGSFDKEAWLDVSERWKDVCFELEKLISIEEVLK